MSYDPAETKRKNEEALEDPQPGDFWMEMFCPYFLIVNVDGDQITVLSCIGGPSSYNRKEELNARIDTNDGWRFDYSKHMVVDRAWIKRTVTYDRIPGFVADVYRCAENINSRGWRCVQEWKKHRADVLMAELQKLGIDATSHFMGLDL